MKKMVSLCSGALATLLMSGCASQPPVMQAFIDSEVFILKYSVMPSHGDDGNHRHEKAFA